MTSATSVMVTYSCIFRSVSLTDYIPLFQKKITSLPSARLDVTLAMASSSPSEFLTFYRTLRASQSALSRSAVRPFSTSIPCRAVTGPQDKKGDMGDQNKDRKHATEKDAALDVQTEQSQKGRK